MLMSVKVGGCSIDQDSSKFRATHDYNLGVYVRRPPKAKSS